MTARRRRGWTAATVLGHSARMPIVPRTRVLPLVAAALLAGCAAGTTVTLRHDISPGASVDPEAARVPAVRVVAVDARPRAAQLRLVVGTAPDPVGIGAPPPDYTAAEPVEATFSKALEAELKARGFALADDAKLTVRLEIRRFFSEGQQAGVLGVSDVAVADLELGATVADSGGGVRYARTITAHAQDPVGVGGLTRTGTVQAVLQAVLDHGLAELLKDDAFLGALKPPTGSS